MIMFKATVALSKSLTQTSEEPVSWVWILGRCKSACREGLGWDVLWDSMPALSGLVHASWCDGALQQGLRGLFPPETIL